MDKPKIAITIGDPAGVGPEIIAKILAKGDIFERCEPVVYGDGEILERACALIGVEGKRGKDAITVGDMSVPVINPLVHGNRQEEAGTLFPEGPTLMMEAVKKAVIDATSGFVDGVVTCPINKASIRLSGYDYPGHTEFIRDLTGVEKVVMMLAGERLKVALVTIHVSLRGAIDMVNEELILETIEIVHRDFVEKLGMDEPKIAVAGLNPHGGEGGLFGNEERVHIVPAVKRAGEVGMNVSGPHPPDTIFYRAYRGEFDVVISMYHDQGLIPLKLVHFDTGVNVTLGLPIVRTSVDHGTAYDIAWKGIANETSLQSAVMFALKMLKGRPSG